jgi:hypothetical protein
MEKRFDVSPHRENGQSNDRPGQNNYSVDNRSR